SHVIIACAGVTPPDNTVTQAAQLAAYYAESTGGQNIAVDMTPVKQVKKIRCNGLGIRQGRTH
ncbi:MAG: hypothetical protein II209_06735, partial [Alistipes sp.]|nr:hypothetical protein [Alistipes sp.]